MVAAKRDYSLTGPEGAAAVVSGLAFATWYASPVPREQLGELMRRRDGPAIRDTLIWFACLLGFGGAGEALWGSWWAVPAFAIYGVFYGSASDSRWHECGHRTAFKTRWMNDAVYWIACFMILREPVVWRWSHVRHHVDTIVVGRDPEIGSERPPNLFHTCLAFFALRGGPKTFRAVAMHAMGRISAAEASFIPAREQPRLFRDARMWLAIYAVVIASAVAARSVLPLMLVGLPSFYGAWLHVVFGLTQHAGLAEDVVDHRLNCRTVYMNPVFRFIYWNMNYHVEHHMFPMVPYHALPTLHAIMKADTPEPYPGLIATYREIIPALLRQRREPDWFVQRRLPPGARPFQPVPQPMPETRVAAE